MMLQEISSVSLAKYAEAISFFEQQAVTLESQGVPSQNIRSRWNSVKKAIYPHLTGNIPTLVNQAFDNEFERQKNYRRKVYRSESMPILEQALLNIYKIVQSDDFVIQYGVDGVDSVENLLQRVFWDKTPLSGGNIKKIIFNALYRFRASDANGYIGIFPKTESPKREMAVVLYPSENIIYLSRDICIFAVPSQVGVVSGANIGHVYTKKSTFAINLTTAKVVISDDLPSGGWVHNTGEIGCFVTGGTAQIAEEYHGNFPEQNDDSKDNYASLPPPAGSTNVVYYNSGDWSYAVGAMDRLEAANSNMIVSVFRHVFPKLVGIPINCTSCKGHGSVEVHDKEGDPVVETNALGHQVVKRVTCKSCNGAGTSPVGVQDIIEVPSDTSNAIAKGGGGGLTLRNLKDSVVAYVTPEITTTQMLYEIVNNYKLELKETLNLQKYANLAESGEAKKIDNEAGMPRLRAIAEGLAMLIQNMLRSIVNLDFNADFPTDPYRRDMRLSTLSVSVPSYFDTQTVAEAEAAYKDSLESDAIIQRYRKRLALMKKLDKNVEEIATFNAAFLYTYGSNLYTFDELSAQLGQGIITPADFWIIQHIEPILERLRMEKFVKGAKMELSKMADYSPIFSEIDAIKTAKAAEIAAAQPKPPAPLSNALDEDDEDDTEEEPPVTI